MNNRLCLTLFPVTVLISTVVMRVSYTASPISENCSSPKLLWMMMVNHVS